MFPSRNGGISVQLTAAAMQTEVKKKQTNHKLPKSTDWLSIDSRLFSKEVIQLAYEINYQSVTNTHDRCSRNRRHKSTPFSGVSAPVFRTTCDWNENFWRENKCIKAIL